MGKRVIRSKELRTALWALAAISVAALAMRAAAPTNFFSKDQPKIAEYAIDMLDNGRWLLPRAFLDFEEPATKPPLLAWMVAGIGAVTGEVSEVGSKIPIALSLVGTVLLTLWIGATISSVRVGFLAGLITLLSYHVLNHGWILRPDMLLVALTWAGLACFVGLTRAAPERRLPWRIGFWGLACVAFLNKGPLGTLLIVIPPILDFAWRRKLMSLPKILAPGRGLLLCLAVILVWLVPTMIVGGQEYWDHVVVGEFLHRVTGDSGQSDRVRSPLYYVPFILSRMLPWTLILLMATPMLWANRRDRSQRSRPMAWAVAIYAVCCLSTSKRADYILPLYPALALIIAQVLVGFHAQWRRSGVNPAMWKWGALGLGVLGILVGIALIVLMAYGTPSKIEAYTEMETEDLIRLQTQRILPLAIVFAIASVAGGVMTLRGFRRGPLGWPIAGVTVWATAYLMSMFWILTDNAFEQSGVMIREFCEEIEPWLTPETELRFIDPRCDIARVYLRRLGVELDEDPGDYELPEGRWAILTRGRNLETISENLGPIPHHVVAESPEIPDVHSTLVLVVPNEMASPGGAGDNGG